MVTQLTDLIKLNGTIIYLYSSIMNNDSLGIECSVKGGYEYRTNSGSTIYLDNQVNLLLIILSAFTQSSIIL